MGLAGGIFGAQGFTTFSEDTINATTQEAHRDAYREPIARGKNHPSVVIWSFANEPESDTPASRDYFAPLPSSPGSSPLPASRIRQCHACPR